VDRGAEVPIGVQLAWALRKRIAEARFQAGQRLPGMRELAEATGVNVNTVRAVYQRLEQDGLIDTQQGSGTFVAAAPQQGAALGTIAANAAHEARETGLDPREVAAALYVSEGQAQRDAPAQEHSEIAARRSLRRQIAEFERALAELEAEYPGVAPVAGGGRRGIGPTLLTVAELAQVRASLIHRLAIVQGAIDDHIEGHLAATRPLTATAKSKPAEPKAVKPPKAKSAKRPSGPRATTRPAQAGT
jgi:DNA-binding transcriptional regulator YhcF (GntR family)